MPLARFHVPRDRRHAEGAASPATPATDSPTISAIVVTE